MVSGEFVCRARGLIYRFVTDCVSAFLETVFNLCGSVIMDNPGREFCVSSEAKSTLIVQIVPI